MSTSSTQPVISKQHAPLKGSRLFEEMADSRPRGGCLQDKRRIQCAKKQISYQKLIRPVKMTSNFGGTSTSQSWDNLQIKIHNDLQ